MGKTRQNQVSGNSRKTAFNAVKSRPQKSKKHREAAAKSTAHAEVPKIPETCCSNCQTVFEVSLELLSTSDTRVRCGECRSVFDALANLRDIRHTSDQSASNQHRGEVNRKKENTPAQSRSPSDQAHSDASSIGATNAAALAGLANDTSSLDMTYSDFDLFSAEAGLPEVHFLDSTRYSPNFHFDDVAEDDDETFSDTLFAQDATMDTGSLLSGRNDSRSVSAGISSGAGTGFISNNSASDPLVFNYREKNPTKKSVSIAKSTVKKRIPKTVDDELVRGELGELSADANSVELQIEQATPSSPWLLRIGLLVLVAVIAASLYAYRERKSLVNNSSLRPILASACSVLSCQLPEQIDLDALRAVDRSVVMHPTVPNALVIKFGIVNQADFSQPYPVLEIRLTDRAGRLVVRNRFLPNEYSRGWEAGDVLDTGKRLNIGLAVEDPGNNAMSFELDFYEVK